MVEPRYDPARSQLTETKLSAWLGADVTDDLQTVPGVGSKAAENLRAAGVVTVHGLLGQFLLLKVPGDDAQTRCDAFFRWLVAAGVHAHRAGIVQSVAEKVNVFLPGLYDPDLAMRD